MADGPVIQKAGEKALALGIGMVQVLAMVRASASATHTTPVVLMGYANPVERYDQKHGAGALCAMPPRPAWTACWSWTTRPKNAKPLPPPAAHGMDLIFLLAPTSTDERMAQVARVASGYVYYVSLKGVTGAGTLDTGAVEPCCRASASM
jgi:tryptophan synthase alpha chain